MGLASTLTISAQNAVPKAAVRNVTDNYFGTVVTDPYRWMENTKSEEAASWLKAQSDYAHQYLENLPLKKEFFNRMEALSDAGDVIFGVKKRGNHYFYVKRGSGDNNLKVYMRDGKNGAEKLLIDPEKFTTNGNQAAVNSYSVSPDGKYISFLVALGGGEYGDIRVLETATGKVLNDLITETRWESGAWLPNSKSFSYNKLQRLAADAPQTERIKKITAYQHVLGTDSSKDKPQFGYNVNPEIAVDPRMIANVTFPEGQKYAIGILNDGVSQNSEFYIAPMSTLSEAIIPWKKIIGFDDKVKDVKLMGDYLYLLTYKDAARFKVVRVKISDGNLKNAEIVFAASTSVVENINTAKDGLYVGVLDGGGRRIYHVDYQNLKQTEVKSPFPGSVFIREATVLNETILLGLDSWTMSNAVIEYDPKTKTISNTNILKQIPVDLSDIEVTNAFAKSHDGTMVPMVILRKKGLALDGKNPLLMNGYGAYGAENTSPFFDTYDLPWLEKGGIAVFAGIRGGGEYGEEWHMGGFQKTKPNTWKDFIACAEYLIANKYTSAEHLGIQGGSAGGILISNCIAERPELFAAAVDNVGINNVLRYETTPNGPSNIGEFGSTETEEGFRNLLAMDGYLKVKDNTKYPAVLLTHGINDPRVEPWFSAKMAARLQAATTSGKPILLRIDYDGGHGFGSSRKQMNEERAETMAFLWQQLSGK